MATLSWRGRFGLAVVALSALLVLHPPFQNAQWVGWILLVVLSVLELFAPSA